METKQELILSTIKKIEDNFHTFTTYSNEDDGEFIYKSILVEDYLLLCFCRNYWELCDADELSLVGKEERPYTENTGDKIVEMITLLVEGI